MPIIEHPDVRRMLLDMKSRVEGIRALVVKLADAPRPRQRAARGQDDAAGRATTRARSTCSCRWSRRTAPTRRSGSARRAIQVYGGAGFLKDYPVEQYCRDSKIFSIYEGTNHIQAMDLVGRKLGQRGGANLQAFLADIRRLAETARADQELAPAVDRLLGAGDALSQSAMRFLGWFQSGKIELIGLYANRFLEMLARTAVSSVLLEGAHVAARAAAALPDSHPDRAFYAGKRHAALHYAHLELPGVIDGARFMGEEMRHSLDIPDAGFGRLATE